jgi:hypothetical protein
VGLKLNGTHQLLAYADEVNLLGDNIDTIKKNTEALIDGSKENNNSITFVRNLSCLYYTQTAVHVSAIHPSSGVSYI